MTKVEKPTPAGRAVKRHKPTTHADQADVAKRVRRELDLLEARLNQVIETARTRVLRLEARVTALEEILRDRNP